jgi:hypothetical protein
VAWMALVILGFEYAARGTRLDPRTRTGAISRAGMAILPAIVVAAISFEGQIVPDAKCANESIALQVGSLPLTFGPEFGAIIRRTDPASGSQKILLYSPGTTSKGSLKKLCDVSDNGQFPFPVDIVRFNGKGLRDGFAAACSKVNGTSPEYCSGYSEDVVQSISKLNILSPEVEFFRTFAKSFQQDNGSKVFKGGTLDNGYICKSDDDPPRSIRCIIRRPLGADATVLADGYVKPDKTREQTVEALNKAIDFKLLAFDPLP